MAAGYRFYTGDLRSGGPLRLVDLTGGSWSTPLGEPGSVEGSFPLRSGEWPSARSDAAAGKSFLAVSYVNAAGDETFLEAGPIWKLDCPAETDVLNIGAAGLASYFDHRKVMKVLVGFEDPAESSVTYSGKQLGLIAKRLVELAQTHTGGDIPIVFPSDADLGGAGTDHERTYPGYELGWVGERLKQLSEVEGGPEVQFLPRRRTDDPRYLEWVMRIGVAPSMLLTQSGRPWTWDQSVRQSAVRGISVSSDGTRMAFRQWAAGQGEAEGRPIAKAEDSTLIDAGFALLEGDVPATDAEGDPAVLGGYARAALAFSQRPIESWTVKVSRDSFPTVGQYRPGDWASFVVRDHVYLPDATYSMRILSIAGGGDDTVTLTLSERLGEL